MWTDGCHGHMTFLTMAVVYVKTIWGMTFKLSHYDRIFHASFRAGDFKAQLSHTTLSPEAGHSVHNRKVPGSIPGAGLRLYTVQTLCPSWPGILVVYVGTWMTLDFFWVVYCGEKSWYILVYPDIGFRTPLQECSSLNGMCLCVCVFTYQRNSKE